MVSISVDESEDPRRELALTCGLEVKGSSSQFDVGDKPMVQSVEFAVIYTRTWIAIRPELEPSPS